MCGRIAKNGARSQNYPGVHVTGSLIKVELHTHTSDDPSDPIGHSASQLIDRAADLGYGALAISLHDRFFDDPALTAHARDRGIVLIPAVERTIGGRHVLLLNFPEHAAQVESFEAARMLKGQHPNGLIVAPHPLFPLGNSLGRELLEQYEDLWDAIEVNAFYTGLVDFNRPARLWAARHGKPMVGNGDVHQLVQLGTTYSIVSVTGAVTPDSLCAAIREGRVRVESRPISHWRAASIAVRALLAQATGRPWCGCKPASVGRGDRAVPDRL